MKSSATAALLRLSRVFSASSWALVVKLMNSGLLSVGLFHLSRLQIDNRSQWTRQKGLKVDGGRR